MVVRFTKKTKSTTTKNMEKLKRFNEYLVKTTLCPYVFGVMLMQITLQIIGVDWIPTTKPVLFLFLFIIPFAIGLSLRDQINNIFDKYGIVSLIGGLSMIWLGLGLSRIDSALPLAIFFLVNGAILLLNSHKGLAELYDLFTGKKD